MPSASDSHLNSVLNPATGEHRPHHEQYDTHTWAPGSAGERHAGGPLQGYEGVTSCSYATVVSLPGVTSHIQPANRERMPAPLTKEQFKTVKGKLA